MRKFTMKITAFILLGLFLILTPLVFLSIKVCKKESIYSVRSNAKGAIIDFGEVWFSKDPFEFHVPFKILKITPSLIKSITSSCGCTTSDKSSNNNYLSIFYRGSNNKTIVHEEILLLMMNGETRIVEIHGKMKKQWYSEPCAIVIEDIMQDETYEFNVQIKIQEELSRVKVKRCEIVPVIQNIYLDTKLMSNNEIRLKGKISGSSIQYSYNGNIEVVLDSNKEFQIAIPIKIRFADMIIHKPKVLTIYEESFDRTIIELTCLRGRIYSVSQIATPQFLKVLPSISKDQCILEILPSEKYAFPDNIACSEITLSLNDGQYTTSIKVIAIPSMDRQRGNERNGIK